MEIAIRRATPGEAEKLTRIAHAAKRHWGYPEGWIALWKEALTITPDFIASNEVYVASVTDEVAGFYALLDHGDKVTLEHLWVMPQYIGRGVGGALFDHAVKAARAMGAATMEIESDPNAEGFYKRMGARRIRELSSEIEGKPRVLPLLAVDVGSASRTDRPKLQSRRPSPDRGRG